MRSAMRSTTLLPAALLLALLPAAAAAQDGFLFGSPSAQITLRAGPVLHRAQGDIFDFMTSELTLERRDLRAPSLGAEFAWLVGPRLDLALGIGWAEAEASSEFADWLGGDGLPIAQTTRLRTAPLTVTARFHPIARGQSVSRLAWLPARTTPYVGGGAGLTFYRLEHDGEFVDTQACEADPQTGCDIFYREHRAGGQAPTVHAVAGLDHWFSPRLGLNLEGRYTLGSARGSDSFRTFDSLDLSGLQATLGFTFRW
jgi:hypothetical protein